MSFIEDNPFDIDEKAPGVDEEDGQNDGEGVAGEMEEVQTVEEEENEGGDKDKDPVENNKEEADKDEDGKEVANGDLRGPVDEEQKPKVR